MSVVKTLQSKAELVRINKKQNLNTFCVQKMHLNKTRDKLQEKMWKNT